jgi:hypothetical protein
MKNSLLVIALLLTVVLTEAATASTAVTTIVQDKIRPSYPFPAFLSTGPYTWYADVEKKPTKGHTFRISTFIVDHTYSIYIEKVQFGDDGCCLEIINYRKLLIDETFLKIHFPKNKGLHGFKLIRWINAETFEFQAYGGTYKLSNISISKPIIEESISN